MKRIVFLMLLVTGSIWATQQASAQYKYEEYTNALNGAKKPLNTGDIVTVTDTLLVSPGVKPTVKAVNEIANIVTLAFNEPAQFSVTSLPDTFSVTVNAKISVLQTAGGSDNITTRNFLLTYSKNNPYKKSDIFYFNDGRRVKVEITGLTAYNIDVNTVKSLLLLSNDLRIDRDYTMDCSDCGVGAFNAYVTSVTDARDTVQVSWPVGKAAEAYDLEWTFIDNTAFTDGRYGAEGTDDFIQNIFRNNASRITVTGLWYNIPLLFNGNGYLYFRYRAVQLLATGERLTSKWSHEYNRTTGLGKMYFAGHQDNLNWQAATSFAEEGKRKSVVQYYDGTLRERQTVTKDNITNNTVVGESLYDRQGRAVITVLPAPTLNTLIQYTPLLNNNLNTPGAEYNKDLYDGLAATSDYCSGGAPGMATNAGASQYYSPVNPLKSTGFNKYIPDAENYPFSETRYTQDNTGRIAAQGGVGKNFRLGTGHETKYYYGAPSQTDLDALFGTDAGDAGHYQKNMVRDANGQYSVSYVDMKGRTVATALTGDAPRDAVTGNTLLESLTSSQKTVRMESLLNATNNIAKDDKVVFTRTILAPREGTYAFTYSLNPQTLQMPNWAGQTICYDCLYDLTITITDECNNKTMPGGVPYVYKKSNFSLNSINSNCTDAAKKFTESFNVLLKEGSYSITKELSISRYGKDYYRENIYMPNNSKTTFEDIYKQQLAIARQQLGDCNTNGDIKYPDENYNNMYVNMMFNQLVNDSIYGKAYRVTVEKLYDQYLQFFGSSDRAKLLCISLYHPEYRVFANYTMLAESNKWDNTMRSIETFQEAYQKGYINPLAMTTQPAAKFTATSRDPFFANIASAADKAKMADSLNMLVVKSVNVFNNKPNSWINLWSAVNMMVKCTPQKNGSFDNACITTYTDPANVFGSQLCETELDDAWNKFKNIYLGKKQQFTNKYLFNGGGYPVLDRDKEQYRIFIDPSKWMNKDSLGVNPYETDGNKLKQQQQEALTNSIDGSCRNYAAYWWSKLAGTDCGGVKFDKTRDSAILINRLIAVCKAGGDETHPLGASTVKPGATATYKSFGEAITDYVKNTLGGDITLCNGVLIDAPASYEKPFITANKPIVAKPDDCECKNIKGLYQVYNDRYKGQYSSMSVFMKEVYKTTITNGALDSLRRLCNDELKCTRIPVPIVLPPVLQCGNVQNICVDCEKIVNAYNAFRAAYPTVAVPSKNQDTLKNNTFFAGYMNDKTGLGKNATEYLNFIDQCNNTAGSNAGSVLVTDDVQGKCVPDAIVVASTGVAKPSTLNCTDLVKTYQNYIAEFPNHTKGAYVRVFVPTGTVAPCEIYISQNKTEQKNIQPENEALAINEKPVAADEFIQKDLWAEIQKGSMAQEPWATYRLSYHNKEETVVADSVAPPAPRQLLRASAGNWFYCNMDGKQLFEWYMGQHLGLTGYTYLHYADWLVNSCGYKLNQLPWSDTVAVRQDTLQNIWNRFINKYGTSINSISETVNVPLVKGVMSNSRNAIVGYWDEVITAGVWTASGAWGIERTSNVYNLSVLPKNASISTAYLNLYAHNTYLFASHFRSATKYPYMQIQAVAGLYIPNKTSPNNSQPEYYTGTPVINFPYTSTNQVSSGNSSDFWSNQNYLNQNITSLVSFMYNNIRSTGINYPVQYKMSDEGYEYKFMEFGSGQCSNPPQRASLNVTYTASRCDVFAAFVNNALGTYMDAAAVKALYESKGKLIINDNCNAATAGAGCSNATERSYVQLSGNSYSNKNDASTILATVANTFTMEFWAKPTSTRTVTTETNSGTGGTNGQKFAIGAVSGQYTDATLNTAGAGVSVGTNGISVCEYTYSYLPSLLVWNGTVSDWTHIAVVYNNKQPSLYVNGQLVRTGLTSTKSKVVPTISLFGGDYGCMNGNLAEVRIWNTARTAAEIQANMNKGTPVSSNGLVAYWPLSEGTGTTVKDIVGARDMQMVNGATWASGSTIIPAATSGRPVKVYASNLLLCGSGVEPTFPSLPSSVLPNACKDSSALANAAAQEMYKFRIDSLLGNFDNEYMKKCLSAAAYESFTMQDTIREYHYTLYYYDQAGNLVKTVAPEDVKIDRSATWLLQVAQKRAAGQAQPMLHAKATIYRYNSLNQVIGQYSPDGNQSNFWYDRLGRLAISRNAEQKKTNLYSYTLYDTLGRITEVGQKQQPNAMTDVVARNTISLDGWVNLVNTTYPHQQVTRTVYDRDANINFTGFSFKQKAYMLRNRVSYTQYFDQLQYGGDSKPVYLNYNQATYYDYDIHGNVDTLLHDYATGAMAQNGFNRFKLIAYNYDLVSGKVNQVSYQPGKQDEMYHRYEYDAENRITDVYTTNRRAFVGDRNVEEREAGYSYYRHGPLARTEIGNNRVQGLDYAYTLQGWLKGVNSTALNPAYDMGADGNNISSLSARDAFGFSLNYYMGDYRSIESTVLPFAEAGAYIIPTANYKPLYNGNISNMHVGIKGLQTLLYNYGYDQLNRLVSMDAYKGFDSTTNKWNGLAAANMFGERVTYDANGNIKTYNRDGNKTGADLAMDRLTYAYKTGTNQLDYISDIGTNASAYDDDIENQGAGNYNYDAIGNLIQDIASGINPGGITWTVYGKIKQVKKSNGVIIDYTYDASGNRISKTLSGTGYSTPQTTWYVRDAQGNTLTTYDIKGSTITANEQFIYGSSRLGVINRNLALNSSLTNAYSTIPGIGNVYGEEQLRGRKQYELSNHLGNVLVTVSDKKKYNAGGWYEADVISAQDYYPGGMIMPGRNINSSSYRFGASSGQEKSTEINDNLYTAQYWEYDSRIGRRWNLDPKPTVGISQYSTYNNNPIFNIDILGDSSILPSYEKFLSSISQTVEAKTPQERNPFHYTLAITFGSVALETKIKDSPFQIGGKGMSKEIDLWSDRDGTYYLWGRTKGSTMEELRTGFGGNFMGFGGSYQSNSRRVGVPLFTNPDPDYTYSKQKTIDLPFISYETTTNTTTDQTTRKSVVGASFKAALFFGFEAELRFDIPSSCVPSAKSYGIDALYVAPQLKPKLEITDKKKK